MPRKFKGTIHPPQKFDHDSPEWRAARRLTHTWCGSAEYERLDSTDAVLRALIMAAKTGKLPQAEPLPGSTQRGRAR